MRITQIDFEGKPGCYATATRPATAPGLIDVVILTADAPCGRSHTVQADCEEDIRSMADCLHHELEGYKGTRGDVDAYYQALLRMSDC